MARRLIGSAFGIAGGVLLTIMAAGAAGLASIPPTGVTDVPGPYVPWIESRGQGVFDPATPQLRGLRVSYRVDARVLLPLGFTSIEILSRSDVGMLVASYRDCETEAGELVRAFELFSVSRPERARGLDRRGFFREVVRPAPGGAAWTAYFGAMTFWPEKTLAEARKAVEGPQSHTFEVIDGLSTAAEMRSTAFLVGLESKVTTPGELWTMVRPQLDTRKPRNAFTRFPAPGKTLPSLAFLGALQVSLRSAAVHRDRPLPPQDTRVPFTHNATIRQLELRSISRDPSYGRRFVASGLVRNPADVFRLDYRVINSGDEGAFRMWAELPRGLRDDGQATPIVPVGWEMPLRSYLKLVFERTN